MQMHHIFIKLSKKVSFFMVNLMALIPLFYVDNLTYLYFSINSIG